MNLNDLTFLSKDVALDWAQQLLRFSNAYFGEGEDTVDSLRDSLGESELDGEAYTEIEFHYSSMRTLAHILLSAYRITCQLAINGEDDMPVEIE
jgi:hypothetical protein